MNASADLLEQFIWELRRFFRELAAAADREFDSLGIETQDRALLEFLARETNPVSLSDLARKYSVSRQHIHQILRRFPHPEWIEEAPDPNDRRAVLLALSRKGRSYWEKIRHVDRALLERLATPLSRRNVTSATNLLKQLRSELARQKRERH